MVNTWLPRHTVPPLKEGRSHTIPHRRSRRRLVVYLVIAAGLVWLLISRSSEYPSSESVRNSYDLAKDRLGISSAPKTPETALETAPETGAQGAAENKASQKSNVDSSPSKSTTSTKNNLKTTFQDGFDAALDEILSISPDELYRQELLRPITSTNTEKLRELGLRSRAYKRYFEAWEKLHVVTNSDDSVYYPIDNLIPYIRASRPGDAFPEALHKYESYRHFLTQFGTLLFPWTSPYFADHMSMRASLHHGGRGIVILVGNNHAHFALAAIPTLRTLGCKLPIEIMYLGEGDLRKDFRVELEALPGVTTRDLSAMVSDKGWSLAGWAGKPYAILLSSFREVILLDADSLFFVNPEVLYDDEDYVRTGALFFKDRLIFPESKREWMQKILPEPVSNLAMQSRLWTGESGHMQESGVVVVDKWMHFVTMLVVCTVNGSYRDGNKDADTKGMYDMVYGDKETYWLGWELIGDISYAFHPGTTAVMGVLGDTIGKGRTFAPGHEADVTMCAPQLLHLGRDNRPMWFNGWLYKNKFAGRERTLGEFEVFMEEPKEVLDPEAWQMGESNMCCLSNSETREFTKKEMDWLQELLKMAKMKENLAE